MYPYIKPQSICGREVDVLALVKNFELKSPIYCVIKIYRLFFYPAVNAGLKNSFRDSFSLFSFVCLLVFDFDRLKVEFF